MGLEERANEAMVIHSRWQGFKEVAGVLRASEPGMSGQKFNIQCCSHGSNVRTTDVFHDGSNVVCILVIVLSAYNCVKG